MNRALVSVIMPVYNVEKYVGQAIQSVIEQTYDEWELILVDDGSTDRSPKICDDYAQRYPGVKVYHIENNGVGNARNYGISKSSGEYIVFLDSDDALDREFLSKMVDKLVSDNSDVVVCNYKSIGDNFASDTNDISDDYYVGASEQCLRDFLDNKFYIYVVWGKLYRKSVIESIKFRTMKIGEDTCFIIDLLKKNISISFMKYEGYIYRSREDGITKITEFGDKDIDRIKIARIFYDIVRDKSIELEREAKDKLCYTFIAISRELLRNGRDVIRKYHDATEMTINNIDYKNTTIGSKRKIYISMFKYMPLLAKRYANLFF